MTNNTGRILAGALLGLAVAVNRQQRGDVIYGRVESTKERKAREYSERLAELTARIPLHGDYFHISEAREVVRHANNALTDFNNATDYGYAAFEVRLVNWLANPDRIVSRYFDTVVVIEPQRTTVVFESHLDPKARAVAEMREELKGYEQQAMGLTNSSDRRRIASKIDDACYAINNFEQYGRKGDYTENRARQAVQEVGTTLLRSY